MIAFPGMLAKAATLAGISIPDNVDKFEEYVELYPHFYVFCLMQLGQSMPYPGVHFDNARIIAECTEDEIVVITPNELIDRGFQIGFSHSRN